MFHEGPKAGSRPLALRRRTLLLGAGAALVLPGLARASTPFLDRPARIVIGFAAASVLDLVARAYAERLRGIYAPQVVVEGRTGAAGRLALEAVKGAAPDGTTMVLTPESTLIIHPHIFPRTLSYDPARDFTPVSAVSTYPFIFCVSPDHPAKDFPGFLAWARGQEDVPYGSAGAGSSPHFLGAAMARTFSLNMRHVPYRDTGMMLTDLQQGRLPAATQVLGLYGEYHRAGRVRILAVSTPDRVPSLPEVPTFAELGHPDLTSAGWYSILTPARTPEPVVAALNSALATAAKDPELTRILAQAEQRPMHTTPEELASRMRRERERWGEIVRSTGFTAEE